MLDPMLPTLADELAARLTARHREHVEQLQGEIARLTRERDLALRYQAQDMRDMAARLRAVEAERDEAREALRRVVHASIQSRRASDAVLSMPDLISDEVIEAICDDSEDAQASLIARENEALALLGGAN